MPNIKQIGEAAWKIGKPALLMGGGAVGNAEFWDKANNPDRENTLVGNIIDSIKDPNKDVMSDNRNTQGILNALIGAGAGGLIHKGTSKVLDPTTKELVTNPHLAADLTGATGMIAMSPAKDLLIKANPAIDHITRAADAASESSKSFKNMPLLLGGLGAGALGLGALGLAKYMSGKKDKDKARIKYTLQGKEGDPTTQAEIDMPVDSPEFSENMLKGLNMGVKRQVGKSIKYNSLKRDPETGKMIPYEKWVAKYGTSKSASVAPEEKRIDTDPSYKIDVNNGKCCCERCDGKEMSIEEAFNATRVAMGLDDSGSLPTNEKSAAISPLPLASVAGTIAAPIGALAADDNRDGAGTGAGIGAAIGAPLGQRLLRNPMGHTLQDLYVERGLGMSGIRPAGKLLAGLTALAGGTGLLSYLGAKGGQKIQSALSGSTKSAGVGASILSGLAGGAVAAGAATSMPNDTNPLVKLLVGGAAGLGTALAGHGIASIGEQKDDGTMAGMRSYLNTGSAMAGFHGVPSIDSDDDDEDWEKGAGMMPPPPGPGTPMPPPPAPQGTQARVPVKPNPPAATPATGAADMDELKHKVDGVADKVNRGAGSSEVDPAASTPQTQQQAGDVSGAMQDVKRSLQNLHEMKQQTPSVSSLGKDLLDDYKANV